MKIGIDISQLAYEGTGVATFLKQTVLHLIEQDKANTYVLFYSSLRNTFKRAYLSKNPLPANVTVKTFRFPPPVLDTVWNKLHIFPIENILGDLDVFISSDWTQPPTKKAKKVTILYDLIVYLYPNETAQIIVDTQKRRLKWVKTEADAVLCISEATKKDAQEILGIPKEKLFVIYPGGVV